jgi:hypothetical protein
MDRITKMRRIRDNYINAREHYKERLAWEFQKEETNFVGIDMPEI